MKSNDSNGTNKLLLASIFFIIGMICFYILQTNQLLPSILLKEKDEKIEVYKIEDTYVKPRIVYHGSPNNNLSVIEPQKGHIRDDKEGSVG